jgi:hypothetical protein
MPVKVLPVPLKTKNRYGMPYPLRPGKTEFRISYKVPYSGSFDFTVSPETSLAELGVLLPKGMKLTSAGFSQDRDEAGMNVFFMKDISAAQPVKFSVSGEGVAPREAQEPPAPDEGTQTAPATGTTAGKGEPRWYLIGLLFGLLVGGAIVLFRKRKRGSSDTTAKAAVAAPDDESEGSMLAALKEELFQLETERLAGRLSQQEYETSKAGMDTLIRREMIRRQMK